MLRGGGGGGGGGAERGKGSECFSQCFSPLVPHHMVFCFELGSAFARLYLLLIEQQKKKHTKNTRQLGRLSFCQITNRI